MVADSTSRVDETGHNLLTPIMTTASTPATPGPSTPTTVRTLPHDNLKPGAVDEEIVPPARPKSTPFPQPDLIEGDIRCSRRPEDLDNIVDLPLRSIQLSQKRLPTSTLCELPIEIHECILDHLFGVRASASSRTISPGKSKVLRSWGTVLRHSRRREVSDLTLVSNKWRALIQDRLYRHLKIKGTRDSVSQAILWFQNHPHLCSHVKHIEIWFPVFQQKNPAFDRTLRILPLVTTPDRSTLLRTLPLGTLAESSASVTYQSPSNNCSLEEAFRFVQMTFGEACILTLEGGERKKPPMVRHFNDTTTTALPVISTIRTLVCKGQWNIIRSNDDFQNLAAALPNLNEWHGSYAKPKSKSYLSMATILPNLPRHLTHLNICLEADYRREAVLPLFVKKVGLKTHFCLEMAKAIPTLEHLAYTGRVCHCFFDNAARLSNSRTSRLKSVDLIVKNCCREQFLWNDGSGVTDLAFILAFEKLVLSGVKSLDRLAALEFLRIRFVDLDSQLPVLNPYFQLENDRCTGIWSDPIVDNLKRTRPNATFVEKSDNLIDVGFKDGQLQSTSASKTRPLSIKMSNYHSLSSGITIN